MKSNSLSTDEPSSLKLDWCFLRAYLDANAIADGIYEHRTLCTREKVDCVGRNTLEAEWVTYITSMKQLILVHSLHDQHRQPLLGGENKETNSRAKVNTKKPFLILDFSFI